MDIDALLELPAREQKTDPRSGAVLTDSLDEFGKLWFLERFPGLSEAEIGELCAEYKRTLPREYLDFLGVTNGLNVMGRLLKIAGKGCDPAIYGGSRIPDPIRFVDGHRTWRTPKSWLFFATYTQWENIGQAHVCMDTGAGECCPVYCLPYNGNKILKRWDSFGDWLREEFTRLHEAYRTGSYHLKDVVPGVVQMVELE